MSLLLMGAGQAIDVASVAAMAALNTYFLGDYQLGSNSDNAAGRAELVALNYAAATTLR